MPWQSRRWRGILAVAFLLPPLAVALIFWQASRARNVAAGEVRAGSEFPVEVAALDTAAPPGVDAIAAPPDFRDVAEYREQLVVSARAGIYVYNGEGELVRSYRAGFELPPVELGAISAGVAAGSAQPEVFVATRGEGLLAFDGSSFRRILPAELRLRIITAVLAAGSGRILLGTEHDGVMVFDGRQLTPLNSGLRHQYITALAGNDADLWIGTLSDGVFHYRGGQLESLAAALPDPQVLSLSVANDAAYAGTPLGVVEFRDGRRTRLLAEGFFAQAVLAEGDSLWTGTEDEGVLRVPLQSRPEPRSSRQDSEGPSSIRRLVQLQGGVFAVGRGAVYRYAAAGRQWQPALTAGPSVLADRNVAALSVAGGRLWVGYFDHGVDIVEAGLDRATHHEDDALFCVNRIVPEPGGARTAVATANGLVLFDPGGNPRQVMGRKDGLLADHVTDVAFRDGGMVVATPAGLSLVDRSGVRSLYVFHGLVNNHVYTVAVSGSQVAAGTLGGLSLLDNDIVRANYTTANSHLKHNWITAVARVGDEWFAGTYGAGVLQLDSSGEWRGFADLKEGFVVNPNALAVIGGRVYAGSLDRGLFMFDRASARWRKVTAGLPSKNVTALAAAGGYLYVGTDNGLVRIAEGALQ